MSKNLPPYIPPQAPPKPEQQKPKPLPAVTAIAVPGSPHRHSAVGSQETVYVMRVTTELRRVKTSRTVITVVHDKLRDAAPALKIVPGMRVQITVLPGDPVGSAKKGGGNAKA